MEMAPQPLLSMAGLQTPIWYLQANAKILEGMAPPGWQG